MAKVLIISMYNSCYPDGGSLYAYKLSKIFKERDFEIDEINFIDSEKHVRKKQDYINQIDTYKRKNINYDESTIFQKIFIFFASTIKIKKLLNRIDADNYDIIINNTRFFSKLNRQNNFIQIQHNDPKTYDYRHLPIIKRWVVQFANLLIFNRNVLKNSKNIVLFDKNNSILKNNILEKVFFVKLSSLNNNEIVNNFINFKHRNGIVVVGRFNSFQKNYILLEQVIEKLPNINFTLIGEKPKKYKNLKNCIFLGVQNHDTVLNEISKHKYSLILSKFEGFPYFAVESICLGVPCIILNSFPSSCELTSYDNELLLKQKNHDYIVDNINKIYFKKEYDIICKKSILYAKNNLSNEIFKEKWNEIINYFIKK